MELEWEPRLAGKYLGGGGGVKKLISKAMCKVEGIILLTKGDNSWAKKFRLKE